MVLFLQQNIQPVLYNWAMPTKLRLSLPQYLALPEEPPYAEFVDREVLQKAMPDEFHTAVPMPGPASDQVQLDIAYVRDFFWERKWRYKFRGLVCEVARRTRRVEAGDLESFENAFDEGIIDAEQALSVRNLDMIIEGIRGFGSELLLAVEMSRVIDEHDVTRAIERAAVLRKVGYNAVPVVAGSFMDTQLRDSAVERGVEVVFGD